MSDKPAKDGGLPARRSAIYLLDQIIGEGKLLPELIGAGALDRLDPADRARAQRLATETLRGMERADRLLQKHLQKYPPLTVRNALRVGTIELCAGEAAHGVVNSMVNVVSRHKRYGHLKGLVNAVLRKVADKGPEQWPALRTPRLPKWLRGPLVEAWGGEAVLAMESVQFEGAPLDLSVNGNAADVAKAVGGKVLPTGSVRLMDAGQVSALPGFTEGQWWVQDAAAAIPARVLDAQKGEAVLDLCAAPGGKTLQLAATGADATAVDISEGRMERVKQNLVRTKLTAKTQVADAFEVTGQYDAILLDAPCSATGTIRRHPDLPFAKDGSEFGALIDLQARMLDHAVTLLKPGGRMVFCTCSLLPDEGEVQVEEALGRHPSLTVDRDALDRPGIDPAWITEEGGLRLRPDHWADQGGMDGFYVACLRKTD
ncbi:RsmB/NOP family class I SAM-dependent RNA methyltransferase [uncultured Tateyamaria sp.]|uniref:RsmB/NOP family class I SAM-dependent RNA methyltransferase n=1 Tax=uncultured Tateyamaria sp. TaxID=455651 RepID=UPI00260AD2C5|nr:RsmB/NOP family class I SAM-dependent RNA methyltransferase [uncultured Tateyamaria sp.]